MTRQPRQQRPVRSRTPTGSFLSGCTLIYSEALIPAALCDQCQICPVQICLFSVNRKKKQKKKFNLFGFKISIFPTVLSEWTCNNMFEKEKEKFPLCKRKRFHWLVCPSSQDTMELPEGPAFGLWPSFSSSASSPPAPSSSTSSKGESGDFKESGAAAAANNTLFRLFLQHHWYYCSLTALLYLVSSTGWHYYINAVLLVPAAILKQLAFSFPRRFCFAPKRNICCKIL